MADEEAEREKRAGSGAARAAGGLSTRLEALEAGLRDGAEPRHDASSRYCRAFCQMLVEYVAEWRSEEEPWPVLEGYAVALLSYARASQHLSIQCEDVHMVLEQVSLSCVELLLSITAAFPHALWEQFRFSIQRANLLLQEKGVSQLGILSALAQEGGIWTDNTLQSILNNEALHQDNVHTFLAREGPEVLQMRVKYLIKENQMDRAALLAKACAAFPEFDGRGGNFKQIYLVCLCTVASQQTLMDELSKVDCREALEMICNLEAEGDERGAFTLCSGFLSRQLLQEDTYCAWELTLFWSKLLKRLEPSEQGFLERCRQMSLLAKTVFHLLFFIKVIQSELDKSGLPACIEMCIRALRMESCEGANKATICKTISCLLPADLEVKRACQLTEFLLEPTVDSYYAVETLYNEPDQKPEEESLPIPNSLRCELLLVFKTQWPFDPEFWDWKALKRHCLGLMGEEASIVSSIDELNDERPGGTERADSAFGQGAFKDVSECFLDTTNELNEIADQKQKNREIKKLREKGFVSARFRNWQAYMQYCVLCDKEFLGHRIVRHAQTHFKDGYYSCPICAETFETRENLDPHVASHVKLSCKERLAAMKTTKKLASGKTLAPLVAVLKSGESHVKKSKAKSDGDSEWLYNGDAAGSQMNIAGLRVDGRESNTCPVPSCRKGFKYFRNLLAHVKDHGEVEEAKRFLEMQSTKIVCQYCRRQFVSVNHLNDHLQVHCGTKPYICIQLNCKASFDSNAELLLHRKDHPVFKARCMFPGCGKIFNEAFRLYDHEAQHYKTFTCKGAGCGKVFHTQAQLDLHEESHNDKKVEAPAPEDLNTPVDPLSDLRNQPAGEEVLEDTLTDPPLNPHYPLSPSQNPSGLVKIKHSIENMLNTAVPYSVQEYDSETGNPSPPNSGILPQQIQPIDNQAVQHAINTPLPLLNEPQPEESLLDALLNDPMLPPPCPLPQIPSYQSILEDFQATPSQDVLQSHVQAEISQNHPLPLYNTAADSEYAQYHPNPQMQAQYQAPYGSNTLPLTHTGHNGTQVMPLPQRLPPQVTPFASNAQVPENRPVQPLHAAGAVPAPEEKTRHKCAYETCPRDYSSYRSLTKHMKAVHPEFYAGWKLARKNNKILQTTNRVLSVSGNLSSAAPSQNQTVAAAPLQNQAGQSISVGSQSGPRSSAPMMQIQTPAAQSAYQASCSNSTYPPASSHLAALESQPFHNQMESILNPIVLQQLGNNAEPSPVPNTSWNSSPVNSSHQQTCHSQAITPNAMSSGLYASNMNTPLQDQGSGAQHGGMAYPAMQPQSNNASCHFLPSQVGSAQRLNNPPAPGHSSDSSALLYSQQPKNNTVAVVRHTDNTQHVVKLERNPDSSLAPPNASQRNTSITGIDSQGSQDDSGSSTPGGDPRRVKRNRRTKWPAIVRDGKFICCRCFREFQSPKSLGGHLSKRSHCKAFDETDLSSDLPTSFLDLLNSPHLASSPQPSHSAHMNPNQPFHSVTKGPLNPKLYPNVTFLHTSDSTYANKPHSEINKQNPPSRVECVGVGQEAYTDSPVTYSQEAQNSVIQHTGNIKEKVHQQQHQVNYTQSCNPKFSDSSLSDPLLSHLLGENSPSTSYNRRPTDNVSKILQAQTLNKMKEIKERSTIVNASGLSNDGLLAAMATLAQNLVSEKSVKEKLREQILAGDFQKRNGLCQGQGIDSLNAQSSIASSPLMAVQQTPHVIQRMPSSDQCPVEDAAEDPVQVGSAAPDGSVQNPVPLAPTDTERSDKFIPPQEEDKMVEIEKALEKLHLHREMGEGDTANAEPSKNKQQTKPSDCLSSSVVTPGYACDSEGCSYRAMTKDALFKHLVKLHNYTEDMLDQCRKEQYNFAPFRCQVCAKTFTRNSNLRTHYQTAHNYTIEQIMRVTRHYCRKSFDSDGSPCPTPSTSDLLTPCDSPVQKTVSAGGQPQHVSSAATPDKSVKSEQHIQFLAQCPSYGSLDSGLPGAVQAMQAVQPSVIKSGPALVTSSSLDPQLNGQIAPRCGMPHESLMPTGPPLVAQNPYLPTQTGHITVDKKPKLAKPKIPKKPKEKKTDMDDVFSPYRPYRCVHQGCVAAFTIQHNLILHYKAVHQSALPKFEDNNEEQQNEEEKEEHENGNEDCNTVEGEDPEVTEFLCQVKDCSRIFQTVTDLLQHYLQLHKLSLDRAGAMMSGMNLGRFQCDQPDCDTMFTAFWSYVSHINKEHKNAKISKAEPVEGTFRCEVEGCDCTYSTRSNLLRHTMKKHQNIYRLQLMGSKVSARGVKLGRPRKHAYGHLEKENREVNKKLSQKGAEKKRKEKRNNYWTKYGKPILKTKEEASALCTKRIPLQYPCMIKGCERVTGSERNLMKHYLQHGLPKQYLEEQRSNYIYCKKLPRSRYKRIKSRSDDTDKSDESSVEMSGNEETADTGPSESEFSKPTSEKESTEDADVSDAKPSTDTNSDISVVVKRKRGRPRKGEGKKDKSFTQRRTTRLRSHNSYSINYADINSDSTSSSATLAQEDGSLPSATLSSFKPMGFEVSFLKFLESSHSSGKRKASVMLDVHPHKRSSHMYKRSDSGDVLKLVEFKNPQKLTSLTNVTFEVHQGFSNVFELLLKQLHEMRPAVVIQKEDCT